MSVNKLIAPAPTIKNKNFKYLYVLTSNSSTITSEALIYTKVPKSKSKKIK